MTRFNQFSLCKSTKVRHKYIIDFTCVIDIEMKRSDMSWPHGDCHLPDREIEILEGINKNVNRYNQLQTCSAPAADADVLSEFP